MSLWSRSGDGGVDWEVIASHVVSGRDGGSFVKGVSQEKVKGGGCPGVRVIPGGESRWGEEGHVRRVKQGVE